MHPLELIPTAQRSRWFKLLLAATLAIGAALLVIDTRLRTAAAPHGIVSFAFARDAERATLILQSWTTLIARGAAGLSLGLDFLFLPLYSSTIALACLWAGARARNVPRFALLARPLAWGQWLAAALDAIENVALIVMFDAIAGNAAAALIAFCAAAMKFSLVLCGLLYVAAALFIRPELAGSSGR